MLQKQTEYGLGKLNSNSSKDLMKGVRKSMQLQPSRTNTSLGDNPFALRDRDLN